MDVLKVRRGAQHPTFHMPPLLRGLLLLFTSGYLPLISLAGCFDSGVIGQSFRRGFGCMNSFCCIHVEYGSSTAPVVSLPRRIAGIVKLPRILRTWVRALPGMHRYRQERSGSFVRVTACIFPSAIRPACSTLFSLSTTRWR